MGPTAFTDWASDRRAPHNSIMRPGPTAMRLAALLALGFAATARGDGRGRPGTLANEPPAACRAGLQRAGVAFDVTEDADTALRLVPRGPVATLSVAFVGRNRVHAEMDCRLAHALVAWAPVLRDAGVTGIRHLSAYRPRAVNALTGRQSGHATGMALDARYFDREDGSTWDVTADWGPYERGAPPCATEPSAPVVEATPLRRLVCDAVREGRFQVVVTPNRDAAHADHVHLELVPEVSWSYAR